MSGFLPEGVELGLEFFIVSDDAGIEASMKISGLPELPDFALTPVLDPLELLASVGSPTNTLKSLASDWRMMTSPEISDYKRRKREEEAVDRRADVDDLDEI